MGTWEGWQNSVEGAATPAGPVVKRDGKKVICLTPKEQRLLEKGR
jgi:hypothetical protein